MEVEVKGKALLEKVAWHLKLTGLWPTNNRTIISHIKCFLCIGYFSLHVFLEYCDFVSVAGNLQLMMLNLMESAFQTLVVGRLIAVRFAKSVTEIRKTIQENNNSANYKNKTHQEIHLKYISISANFYKISFLFALIASIHWFTTPFREYQTATTLRTPYRVNIGIDMSSFERTVVIYICQIPMLYIPIAYITVFGFIFIAVTNVCSQLAILSNKIMTIDINNEKTDFHSVFYDIVQMHLKIIHTAKSIDDAFNGALFVELILNTVLIGILFYQILVTINNAETMDCLMAILYVLTMISTMFANCLLGEYLQEECKNLLAAYYHCNWHSMPLMYKKCLIISMIRAQIPLQITAGKFYIFSLENFTSIMKSSMAYVSMLRTMI